MSGIFVHGRKCQIVTCKCNRLRSVTPTLLSAGERHALISCMDKQVKLSII